MKPAVPPANKVWRNGFFLLVPTLLFEEDMLKRFDDVIAIQENKILTNSIDSSIEVSIGLVVK